jgi:hypothetical protein
LLFLRNGLKFSDSQTSLRGNLSSSAIRKIVVINVLQLFPIAVAVVFLGFASESGTSWWQRSLGIGTRRSCQPDGWTYAIETAAAIRDRGEPAAKTVTLGVCGQTVRMEPVK